MSSRNIGVTVDPLFVGATRPPMRFGVTYIALIANIAVNLELFILIKNPLMLLLMLPVHGVCMLLCARDPRFFDLLFLWAQTRLAAHFSTLRYWKGASYSPLTLDLPQSKGQREAPVTAYVR